MMAAAALTVALVLSAGRPVGDLLASTTWTSTAHERAAARAVAAVPERRGRRGDQWRVGSSH